MKCSDLVMKLQAVMQHMGDIDVVILTETPEGLFCVDPAPVAEIVEVPIGPTETMLTCFAVGWLPTIYGEELPEDAAEAPPRRDLKLLKGDEH